MENLKYILLVITSFLVFQIQAQNINCNSFCVLDIQMDSTISNQMNLSIQFNSDSSDFVNYPYVSSIVDVNGDTIAHGNMNFFGQFGGSTYIYTVNSSLNSIPVNFNCQVFFHYDTLLCNLNYPCLTFGINEEAELSSINVFPNPSQGMFNIQFENSQEASYYIQIFNALGQTEFSNFNFQSSNLSQLDLSHLPKGIYFLEARIKNQIIQKKILII